MSVQVPNGVVDIAVEDEAEAVAVAKKYLSYFQGALPDWKARRPAAAAPRDPGEPAARLRRARGDRHDVPTTARCSSCGAPSGRAWSRRWSASRAGRSASIANNPDASRRRDRFATAPTRPRASCSSATPTTCRCCSCATRPASWWARKSRRPRWCGTARGCSSSAPTSPCRSFTIVLRKALWARRAGDGRRQLPARRSSPSPGRPASSAAWASKARSSSATATSWRRSTIPPSARRRSSSKMVAAAYERGKALSTATYFEVDEVIDPAESRHWITHGLLGAERRPRHGASGGPNIDTW